MPRPWSGDADAWLLQIIPPGNCGADRAVFARAPGFGGGLSGAAIGGEFQTLLSPSFSAPSAPDALLLSYTQYSLDWDADLHAQVSSPLSSSSSSYALYSSVACTVAIFLACCSLHPAPRRSQLRQLLHHPCPLISSLPRLWPCRRYHILLNTLRHSQQCRLTRTEAITTLVMEGRMSGSAR